MSETLVRSYAPQSVTPPGATLADVLAEAGMSQIELARRMGRSAKLINEVLQGLAPITPETALQLERVIRIPAHFWLAREARYQEFQARQREAEVLRANLSWLRRFPIAEMIRRGWIRSCSTPEAQLEELLAFFQIASPAIWDGRWEHLQVAYRRNRQAATSREALSVWLCQGERLAREMPMAAYDESAFRVLLDRARKWTTGELSETMPRIIEQGRRAGVAIVIVQELPNAPVSGATRWLSSTQALLQLSLRYRRDDQFWFSFFHEAGHLLLHGKRQIFLDGLDAGAEAAAEHQADRFAAQHLIPDTWLPALQALEPTQAAVRAFAEQVGIAPGIVVGRMQYEGWLPYSHLNRLKRTLHWDSIRRRPAD